MIKQLKIDFDGTSHVPKEVNYVPFVNEVEEFNTTFGKPNNYEPTIPEEKEWEICIRFHP